MLPMPPSTIIARIENETVEQELVRADERELRGVEHAGEPGRRRAEREREELRRDGVQAVGRGRQLVLADGHPGSADPGILEPVDQDHR